MEQLTEALPSDPVILALDLSTSEELMLFKLGHNITKQKKSASHTLKYS